LPLLTLFVNSLLPWLRANIPLLITLLIQSFSALALMVVPVLVPVEATPRLSAAGLGLYLLFAYTGAVLGSLAAGPLVERFGAIRTSQWALLLSAAGLVLAGLWPGAIMFAALLLGMGYGPITPASSHVLNHTTPAHQRNLVFSIKQTGVPVGVALSGFCVPPLATATNWLWTLVILGASCAAVAAMALPIQAQMDADAHPPSADLATQGSALRDLPARLLEPFAVIWRHKPLRVLAAVSFILSGMQIALSAYLVSYLTASLAMTALLAGSVLALSQLGGVLGRIAWGYVADRFLRPLTMLSLLAMVSATASLVTASLAQWGAPPPGLFLAVLMFVFGASASGWNGVYLAEVARQAPPGAVGMATSGTLACTFLGVLLGAPLFGLVAAGRGGYSAAFGLEAALVCGAAITLWLFRTRLGAGSGRAA
jgi:predicted MFS family arabinose efflux permease